MKLTKQSKYRFTRQQIYEELIDIRVDMYAAKKLSLLAQKLKALKHTPIAGDKFVGVIASNGDSIDKELFVKPIKIEKINLDPSNGIESAVWGIEEKINEIIDLLNK